MSKLKYSALDSGCGQRCRDSDAVQRQSFFCAQASELRQCNGVNGISRVYRPGWLQ